MPFPNHVREEALVKSHRHCCVCHEFAGRAINVHHIKQEADGGENTIENSIVLCLRCHSEAGHYNSRHPIGTSYSPAELIKHRDNWWKQVAEGNLSLEQPSGYSDYDKNLLNNISDLFPFDLIVKIQNELFRKQVPRYIIEPFSELIYRSEDPLFSFNNNNLENLRIETIHRANAFLTHFSKQCVGGREGFYDYIDLHEQGYDINVEYWKQYSLDTQSLAYDFCKTVLQLRKELKY